MSIAGVGGQPAGHVILRPDDIYFVTKMSLVVVRPRKDIQALCGTIPVILRIGQVQIGGLHFNLLILGRTGLALVRKWVSGMGVSRAGVGNPMLLTITESRSIEYRLLLDSEKVLRYWSRMDWGLALALNYVGVAKRRGTDSF
jgi:hypothetical protein